MNRNKINEILVVTLRDWQNRKLRAGGSSEIECLKRENIMLHMLRDQSVDLADIVE